MTVTPRRMRVLCVIPQLGPGGAERAMSTIANFLSARHEVVLLTWDRQGTPPFFALAESVHVVYADLGRRSGFARLGRFLWRVPVVRRLATLGKTDVVVSFLDTANITAILGCLGTGVPVVVSERIDPARHHVNWRIRTARRLLYPRAARTVVQTHRVAAYFSRWMPQNIVVIPNPISAGAKAASPGQPGLDGRYRIIAVGRLVPQKGFDRLIEAFASVASQHPNWDVVIFGEGPERGRLEEQVRAAGLAGRVSLPGVTKATNLELAASHIMAFPSHYEGFPNALGEALRAGLPAVGYQEVSGVEEMITHGITGLLLPAREDAGGLADGLDLLMSDAGLRARMGVAAEALGGSWDATTVLAQWEALLVEVAGEGARDRYA